MKAQSGLHNEEDFLQVLRRTKPVSAPADLEEKTLESWRARTQTVPVFRYSLAIAAGLLLLALLNAGAVLRYSRTGESNINQDAYSILFQDYSQYK